MGERKHRSRVALAPVYCGKAIADDPFLEDFCHTFRIIKRPEITILYGMPIQFPTLIENPRKILFHSHTRAKKEFVNLNESP